MFTDASMTGWGVVCDETVIYGKFPEKVQDKHINTLEMWTIYKGLSYFKKMLAGQHVTIFTDNLTCAYTLNNRKTVNKDKLQVLKYIEELLEIHNITFNIVYVATQSNPADAPSRNFEK